MGRESPIQGRVKKRLKAAGAFVWIVHGSAWQESGIADVCACLAGRYVAVETKRRGEKETPLQAAQREKVLQAGGIALVIDGDLEPLERVIEDVLSGGLTRNTSSLAATREKGRNTL